jgi:hypothetical protein
VKSCLSFEKTASSALIFATLGCFAANFSPAQAAPAINTTAAALVESSTQEFSASTDLPTVTEKVEGVSAASEPTVAALANPTTDPAVSTLLGRETSVETTETAASELAVAAPTEMSLPDVETSAGSTELLNETSVADLRAPEALQAQASPTEGDNTQQLLPDAMLEDSLESEAVDDPMDQVTNVSQLRDVQPGDWAFEALRSLVERYGCIAGYPDGTFRGNRAMTRYEFAAGLNACLQQVERLITGVDSDVSQQDLETLQRLVTEFQAEITALGVRVDDLEGRTAFLEDNQFSTTTKLFGQAIFGLQGRSEDNEFEIGRNRLEDEETEINVISNVQLSLFTQFGPRSLLLTSMQAGEGNTGRTFSNTLGNYVGLGFEGDTDNDVILTDLNYRQLIGRNLALIVGPEGVNPVNVFRGVNRIESAGSGPLSRFAQRNPIINIGNGRAGLGFDLQLGTRMSLQGVYSASTASDALNGGIFGGESGETSAGLQLVVSPTDTIDLSFQYINAYSRFGRLGTGVGDDQLVVQQLDLSTGQLDTVPINTNAFGATLEWRVTPGVTFGGWGGYTVSDFKGGSGDIETFNWMAFLNFPDLLGEGNLLGLYVGQPPKITNSDLPVPRNWPDLISKGGIGDEGGQPGTTTHWELFYRLRVSDNISITPGVIVIFDPLHNYDNDTITIGAIRTTFTF